jgi:hypothetical protein
MVGKHLSLAKLIFGEVGTHFEICNFCQPSNNDKCFKMFQRLQNRLKPME